VAFFATRSARVQVGHAAGLPDARALFSSDPTDTLRFARPRGISPERCLALAVMTQALLDLRRAPRGQVLHRDTHAWFLSPDTSWPLSFASICDLFEWNPRAIRHRVLGPRREPDQGPERRLRLVRRR
jgi:hypothetical protein